jgi:putative tryptophan/tyrosine transport system substrate-binding protein
VSFLNSVLAAKRLELLHQIVPKATIIAAMSENSSSPDIEAERRDLLAAAQAIGQQLIVLDVSSDREIETAFTTLVQRGAGALHVGTGAFMNSKRERIVALAARHRIPAIPCHPSQCSFPDIQGAASSSRCSAALWRHVRSWRGRSNPSGCGGSV